MLKIRYEIKDKEDSAHDHKMYESSEQIAQATEDLGLLVSAWYNNCYVWIEEETFSLEGGLVINELSNKFLCQGNDPLIEDEEGK